MNKIFNTLSIFKKSAIFDTQQVCFLIKFEYFPNIQQFSGIARQTARVIINPITALPLIFLVIAIFALMMFFGAFVLPESPRWLMLQGRRENAKAALTRIFNTQEEMDFAIGEIE